MFRLWVRHPEELAGIRTMLSTLGISTDQMPGIP